MALFSITFLINVFEQDVVNIFITFCIVYCIIYITGLITGLRHVFVPHPRHTNVAIYIKQQCRLPHDAP